MLDNALDRLRRQGLTVATAGPRRHALTFLHESSWTSVGLVACDGFRGTTQSMYTRTARSGRVDRAALPASSPVLFSGRRHPMHDEWLEPDYWQLLQVLADPCVFKPPAYWALLWTLLEAEQDFQTQWVDGWSHEERMTGQFLATIDNVGTQMAPAFSSLERATGTAARFSLDYVDTARGRREQLTGADFGVIIHGIEAEYGEWLKVALFQVKKTETFGRFGADLDQLQTLLSIPNLGFYLLFTRNLPSAPPPVVNSAKDFEYELNQKIEERAKGQLRPSSSLGSQVVSASMMEDWAFFVAFALADPRSPGGLPAASPDEAARILLRQIPVQPSRIIAFGLGDAAGTTNWRQVLSRHERDG